MKRKTSRGKYINFDDLIAQQPSTPALGNMGVNARGDRLGKGGEIVESNTRRVRAYYRDNPQSSTSSASLKDPVTSRNQTKGLTPDMPGANLDTQASEVESPAKPSRKTKRSKKSEAQHAQSQDQKKRNADGAEDDSVSELPPTPEDFEEPILPETQTPSIEVITDDGDIIMMTPSEYEAYQAEQQHGSDK